MKPIKPLEKPEKRQKIVDKHWPGVTKFGDGKFIFSQETSLISNSELQIAFGFLDAVSKVINLRDKLAKEDLEKSQPFLPDGAWGLDYKNSIEVDGSIRNIHTSYNLLAEKDPNIIKKLRFYTEAFTGYQLATLELAASRPWISKRLPNNWDDVLGMLAGPPPPEVYQNISIANQLPSTLRLSPPKKFAEVGWLFSDQIINHDLLGYQQIIALMYENGVIEQLQERLSKSGVVKIIEIGGGYGALAYYLMKILNFEVSYSLVDIPESLAFSSIYCGCLDMGIPVKMVRDGSDFCINPDPSLTLIPNIFLDKLNILDGPVDLCINTLSLAEMSPAQVEYYCNFISGSMGSTGLFFEQNRQVNELKLEITFPRYFKRLRKCNTALFPGFKELRGEANIWVNSYWRK